jgi:hypothetical protein
MTWTYSCDPANNQRDQVRFLVGDTDVNNQIVEDEEILWALSVQPSVWLASAIICESVASKYNNSVDEKVGDLSRGGSKIPEHWLARAKWLRNLAATNSLPFFGGLTVSGKKTLAEDTDAVQPSFRRRRDDHPGTSDDTYEGYFRYGYW